MFEAVLDALAEATGCDRSALGALVGRVRSSGERSPRQLIERVAAQERLANAVQAAQLRDLAGFAAARQAQDEAERVPDQLAGRTAGVEVAAALRVATGTAQSRLHDAARAVADHPELLGLVGTGQGAGRVSMVGLRKAMAATDVLEPDQRRRVDGQLADDAARWSYTPGRLAQAAERRVLAADPDAADRRAAAARRRRGVRLGDPVDGTACVVARLRAEEAWAVFGRLDRTARGMRADGDPRPIDTLLADLLVEAVTGIRMCAPGADGDGVPGGDAHGVPGADANGAPGGDRGGVPGEPVRVPGWRSTDGFEPWLWSDPPPPVPGGALDPDPDDAAWDRLCARDRPRDPIGRDATHAEHGGADDQTEGTAGRPGSGGPADTADRGWHPGGDPAQLDHPAHAPPPRPGDENSPQRRLPMRVEVQVVISAATLLGLDDQPGMLRGYGAVPASVVRDIVDTADAAHAGAGDGGARTTLRGLFCDPADGRLVAMDTRARLFTGPLRQFALFRDQGCRLSGGRGVDVDHIVEHHTDGPTAAANAQGLGKHAHVLKDHPGIHVRTMPPIQVGDGLDHLRVHAPDIDWTLPTGHTHRSAPPPALGPGSHPDPQSDSVGEQHFAALLAEAN